MDSTREAQSKLPESPLASHPQLGTGSETHVFPGFGACTQLPPCLAPGSAFYDPCDPVSRLGVRSAAMVRLTGWAMVLWLALALGPGVRAQVATTQEGEQI